MSEHVPTVFSIPPGSPFLETLARAMLDGALGPGIGALSPLELSATTVYLPTMRARRALAFALHREAGGGVLMPHIRALGEIGADEPSPAFAVDGEAGPAQLAVVSDAERHAVLADIAMDWARRTSLVRGGQTDDDAEAGPHPVPRTPVEAVAFAIELARFLDELSIADVSRSALERVVPPELGELARNWEISFEFLSDAMERWTEHLRRRQLDDRVRRRDLTLLGEAMRLEHEGAPAPVIAAGSTGSVPAAATLMRAIARAPNGAVVLPGLDRDLDQHGWREIGPDHPQFGMKRLIAIIGVDRDEVRSLGPAPAPTRAGRAWLVSEAMRPASTADLWAKRLPSLDPVELRESLRGVSLVVADDEHEEARAIALMLRRAADEPERSTALVTPDRMLARRVAGELGRWGMSVDDSAGQPLATTRQGTFLRLLIEAVSSRFAPVEIASLLKHPLTRLGLSPGTARHGARIVEIAALRGVRPGPGLEGLRAALERTRTNLSTSRCHPVLARLDNSDFSAAADLLRRLGEALQPISDHDPQGAQTPLSDLVRGHVLAAEALARVPEGEVAPLWAGDDGHAMAAFLAELAAASAEASPIRPAEFGGWFERMMHGRVVRLARRDPASIAIWGPLEARLQHVDRLILGGLNEGTWPSQTETDPWLGRQMREALGLDAPERHIGLQAHDVAQALGGDEVIVTRAKKSGGTPAVASRWLWRLTTLLDAAGASDALQPSQPWIGWARRLDAVDSAEPCAPPSPTPPVAARPKRLSVTRIETLMRDPYAIYASEVLGLRPLDPLDLPPDAADYGTIVHAALGRLFAQHPTAPLPDNALEELLALGREEFSALDDRPGLKAYWWLRFERIAGWLVEADRDLRNAGTSSHCELSGQIELDVEGLDQPFILNARADRIDIDGTQAASLIDFKTGKPPTEKQIEALLAPQLPLEAAILAAGGFPSLGEMTARTLVHVALSGREPAGEILAAQGEPSDLAERSVDLVRQLIASYARAEQPYLSRIAVEREGYAGDFDHLARVGEWSQALKR